MTSIGKLPILVIGYLEVGKREMTDNDNMKTSLFNTSSSSLILLPLLHVEVLREKNWEEEVLLQSRLVLDIILFTPFHLH